jgi:hypothetical protein
MYEVLKKGRLHNLSIQCQLDIFDKTVKPILLYGCETWGFGKNDIIERVQLNTRTFDFSAFTLSFHFLQKSLKTFSWFCISSFDSDIITVSSAYKSTKSFK